MLILKDKKYPNYCNGNKGACILYKVNECVSIYAKQWETLYLVLKSLKKEKKKLLIGKIDNILFTILSIEEEPSSCGSCCTRYPAFTLYGTVTADYFEDPTKEYKCSASISMATLHKCITTNTFSGNNTNNFEENIFFCGHVENTDYSVCHRYIDYISLLETYTRKKGDL